MEANGTARVEDVVPNIAQVRDDVELEEDAMDDEVSETTPKTDGSLLQNARLNAQSEILFLSKLFLHIYVPIYDHYEVNSYNF
ncbi:hypothetical protein Ddc_12132 [Ditylenchus destructor]|nr:hypothetical protein Ddc_12132 [Ditylenchus destructor]